MHTFICCSSACWSQQKSSQCNLDHNSVHPIQGNQQLLSWITRSAPVTPALILIDSNKGFDTEGSIHCPHRRSQCHLRWTAQPACPGGNASCRAVKVPCILQGIRNGSSSSVEVTEASLQATNRLLQVGITNLVSWLSAESLEFRNLNSCIWKGHGTATVYVALIRSGLLWFPSYSRD